MLGTLTLDELVDGVRPDIVGELFVLDRLGGEGTVRLAASHLVKTAWLAHPESYRGFVQRAAADHAEHARLLDLLVGSATDQFLIEGAELAVAVIPLLKRSDHPALAWILNGWPTSGSRWAVSKSTNYSLRRLPSESPISSSARVIRRGLIELFSHALRTM